jgi:hypothetical protein
MSLSRGGREEGAALGLSVLGEVKGTWCPSETSEDTRNFTGNFRLTRKQGWWRTAAVGFLGTPGREDDFLGLQSSEGFGGGPRRPERLEPERVKAE